MSEIRIKNDVLSVNHTNITTTYLIIKLDNTTTI